MKEASLHKQQPQNRKLDPQVLAWVLLECPLRNHPSHWQKNQQHLQNLASQLVKKLMLLSANHLIKTSLLMQSSIKYKVKKLPTSLL